MSRVASKASVPGFASGRAEKGGFREPARSDHQGREHRKHRKLPFAGRDGANTGTLVEPRGIDPLPSSLRTTRAPSLATAPFQCECEPSFLKGPARGSA